MVSQIEEFQFPSLDKYLSSKFTTPIPKNGHRCDICKIFNANNLKARAAHKRGCIRKNGHGASVPSSPTEKFGNSFSNNETVYPLYNDVSYTNNFVHILHSI